MKTGTKKSHDWAAAADVCACTNFRRASRAVTKLFDQRLEETGLRATQLIVLLEIGSGRAPTIPLLARRLVMDRSTLARGVGRLADRGYVVSSGEGGRGGNLRITPAGERAIEDAVPLWQETQNQLVAALGQDRWEALLETLELSVRAARNAT